MKLKPGAFGFMAEAPPEVWTVSASGNPAERRENVRMLLLCFRGRIINQISSSR